MERKSGGQPGNKNGASKPFETALKAALAQMQIKGRQPLIEIATKLIDAATEGDRQAQVEIANRLDGKAKQQMDLSVNDNTGLAERVRRGRERAEKR